MAGTFRALLAACASALLLALAGCGGGGGGGSTATGGSTTTTTATTQSGRVVTTSIFSSNAGYNYPIFIYIPASYDAGNTAFPTIYVLDGDANFEGPVNRFETFVGIVQQKGVNAVVVGVGGTANRQLDYNFPGIYTYHKFLTLELIPFVESQIRADPKKRIITGLSLSGLVVAAELFLEAPNNLFFTYFLSTEATITGPPSDIYTLEQQMATAVGANPLPVTLILSRGAPGPDTNGVPVLAMYQTMLAQNIPGLQLVLNSYNESHVGTDDPAFTDAIAMIFG